MRPRPRVKQKRRTAWRKFRHAVGELVWGRGLALAFFSRLHHDVESCTPALEQEARRLLAGLGILRLGHEVLYVSNLVRADLENQVARLQSRFRGGAIGLDATHNHAFSCVEMELLREFRSDVTNLHTPVAAWLLAFGAGDILLLKLGDGYLQSFGFAVTKHRNIDGLVDRSLRNIGRQLVLIADIFTVELDDDIATLHAGLVRWAVLVDGRNQRTFGLTQSERLREVRGHFLNLDTQPAANHASMRLELLDHIAGQIDRDGEADAVVGAGAGVDEGVDSDDLSIGIEQRPTRVAGVNRGIGLKVVVIVPTKDLTLGTHDTGGDRHAHVKRISDGHHPIADFSFVGIPQCRTRQCIFRGDLDQGEVGLLILADDLRTEFPLVAECDLDLVGGTDHVVVGQDVAVG